MNLFTATGEWEKGVNLSDVSIDDLFVAIFATLKRRDMSRQQFDTLFDEVVRRAGVEILTGSCKTAARLTRDFVGTRWEKEAKSLVKQVVAYYNALLPLTKSTIFYADLANSIICKRKLDIQFQQWAKAHGDISAQDFINTLPSFSAWKRENQVKKVTSPQVEIEKTSKKLLRLIEGHGLHTNSEYFDTLREMLKQLTDKYL